MARKRYSNEDALKILREIDVHLHDGLDVVSACRKAGISDKTYYYWRKKFGGLGRPQLSEMKALKKENERLKKIVADLQLDSKRLAEQLKKFGKQYKSHVKHTDAPLIFSVKGGGFNAQTIINLFYKLYEEAGITGASSHSGRRQFVTELADKGINARVIQAFARHKHLNTTMRYIDINENKMRIAIELIE